MKYKTIFILSVFFIVLLSIFLWYYFSQRPIYTINYGGIILNFRADLREANKVPVYPNESLIHEILWDPEIKNVTIVFMNTTDVSLTAIQAFEIAYKLTIAYKMHNYFVTISAKEVNSFENLSASKENPFIALAPPSISNETLIETENNVIFIKAKTNKEFDLAAVKLMIIALEIL
jgi:hypothetical protein